MIPTQQRSMVLALLCSMSFAVEPVVFCRQVPERADDFAWENDLVAFRAYGPALRGKTEDSGIDVWQKRVPYPIINHWYADNAAGKPYHIDRGEGLDAYHTGSSRGTGGTALWVKDRLVTAGPYRTWRISAQESMHAEFTLTYTYPATATDLPIEEIKDFSIKAHEPWFTVVSTFTRGGQPVSNLTIAIGVTTHDGQGKVTLDPLGRWLMVEESIQGQLLWTGLALPVTAQLREVRQPIAKDASHALGILTTDESGVVRYRAGYGWAKAGRITSAAEWQHVLATASTSF